MWNCSLQYLFLNLNLPGTYKPESWLIILFSFDSENPASTQSALPAQCAGVLPAASLRAVPGPRPGIMDVSPPQTSLRPRRLERGERGCAPAV